MRTNVCVFTMLIAALWTMPVLPQEIEEIVVTASRRAVNLQESGATVTAFGEDDLTSRSTRSPEDLASFTPGLNVASYQTETSFYIRGIGTPAIIAGNDNAIATYVDGVFYSRAAAVGPAFFDLNRVEVLRGPQGTLYGRNATGGAVLLVPNLPSEETEFDLTFGYGNFDAVTLEAALGGKITEGVRGRIALLHEKRDGYTDLIRPDGSRDDVENRDILALRGSIEIDLSEAASLRLTADYFTQDDQASVFHYASAGYADEVPGWLTSREGSVTGAYFAFKQAGRQSGVGSRDLFSDVAFRNEADNWGLTAVLDWQLLEHDLKVIANRKDTNPSLQNEFDSSDAFINVYQREEDHEQHSIEFQLTSPANKKLQWIVGGYYFEEENLITNNVFGDFWEPILTQGLLDLQAAGVIPSFPVNIPQTPLCCDLHLNGAQESEAWAIYLETTYQLTDRLKLSVGGRYSEEERDGRQDFELIVLDPGAGPGTRFAPNVLLFPAAISTSRDGVVPDPFGFVVAPVLGPETFDSFTPNFGVEYQATDDVLLYASIQKAFKSGGYNIGSSQRTAFKPEEIWGYEVGAKWTALDRRFTLNGSVFHYDYENLQAQDSVQNQPIIRNVGEAEVDGIEIEMRWLSASGLSIDATATYLDAEFTKGVLSEPLRPAPLTQAPGTLQRNLSGLNLPRAPELKFNLGAQYGWTIGNLGDVSIRADYAWQSEIFFTVFNIDAASEDDYGTLNLRAQFTDASQQWSLSLYGKNLGDETYFTNQILTGSFYGSEFVGSLGAPRTYGIEFRYSH